jgi:hypothetical protein
LKRVNRAKKILQIRDQEEKIKALEEEVID